MATSSTSASASKGVRPRQSRPSFLRGLTPLILTQREVRRLLDMRAALRLVAQAFLAQARGEVVMPPKLYLPLPQASPVGRTSYGASDFRAMPAYLAHPPACGMKWVNVHPGNRAKGLPTVMAVILINDPRTGALLGILDGTLVTRLRTGAAAGVAAKALARPDSRIVGLVGCGAQALDQLLALEAGFRLRQIRVWGYDPGEARRFCRGAQRHLRAALVPAAGVQRCVEGANLIVTITPSRRPLVKRSWVAPGTHINAVGADAPGKQELDPAILRDARVVVDDREQAIHGGEINVPVTQGLFRPRDIHATVGEVLLGRRPGRTRPQQITVFDSTGLAVHDVAVGTALLARARHLGIGRQFQLS
ncbi:MAG: ornithine cyclodeaminase family protein [Candidatus Omnitrophica bacterium]|nr:ornithine cyclodeaminase family protein [Candidatus Omnitrophota bacterium]